MRHPTVGQTLDTVRHLFAGKTDAIGEPYWKHCVRVMTYLPGDPPDYLLHAALLHDVIEDCGVTSTDLRRHGYSNQVIDLVKWVSRPEGQFATYLGWIVYLVNSAPVEALILKHADVTDNSDPGRLAALTAAGKHDQAARFRERYAGIANRLTRAIEERSVHG